MAGLSRVNTRPKFQDGLPVKPEQLAGYSVAESSALQVCDANCSPLGSPPVLSPAVVKKNYFLDSEWNWIIEQVGTGCQATVISRTCTNLFLLSGCLDNVGHCVKLKWL